MFWSLVRFFFCKQHLSLAMLSTICYQQIKDNFWYAQYGEFTVVMMKDRGYINATKLCKDGGKDFRHWKENATAKALISTLEQQLRLEASDISKAADEVIDLTCGDRVVGIPTGRCYTLKMVNCNCFSEEGCIISGSYIHALLIPHVACWIIPESSFKASRIIKQLPVAT
jgi:hypothetical protein